jgi:hypothetical protein
MDYLVSIMEPLLTELIVKSYEGETLEDENNVMAYGSYHGKGVAKFDNGCTYTGNFRFGLFHGNGIFQWSDGTSYEGDFLNGQVGCR